MQQHLPLFLWASLAMLLATSCGVPPMDAVRDLAAIHTADTWRPRTPADMTVSPEVYLGDAAARRLGAGTYEVADHRTLELAILEQLNQVDPSDPANAVETSSWLLIELLKDDYPGARIAAAKILSNLAGRWISAYDARLVEEVPGGDLTAAIEKMQAATDGRSLNSAARELSAMSFPDAGTALRVLTALGRRADTLGFTDNEANQPLYALALKLVMIGLEEGSRSADADVAEACRERYELLLSYAQA
jgi:hypothetical protein